MFTLQFFVRTLASNSDHQHEVRKDPGSNPYPARPRRSYEGWGLSRNSICNSTRFFQSVRKTNHCCFIRKTFKFSYYFRTPRPPRHRVSLCVILQYPLNKYVLKSLSEGNGDVKSISGFHEILIFQIVSTVTNWIIQWKQHSLRILKRRKEDRT
jgi:hypothetical protein